MVYNHVWILDKCLRVCNYVLYSVNNNNNRQSDEDRNDSDFKEVQIIVEIKWSIIKVK